MTEPLRASLHTLNHAAYAAARAASAAGRQDLHDLLCRIATEVDSAVDAEAPAAAPSWIVADRRVDATDLWHEAGGNEHEVCEAYLHATDVTMQDAQHRDQVIRGFELRGISVNDDRKTVYHDRAEAMERLGYGRVYVMEINEMEAAS